MPRPWQLEAHQQAWQLCLAHGSYASLDVLIGSYASLGSYALHGAEVLLNEIHQPYVCMQAHAYIYIIYIYIYICFD